MDKMPSLNPQNLVVFYLVANAKSLTSAAEKLHFTQPGISYHIRALESYTNLKLIDIKKQRVFLTPAGEVIYNYAKEIYQQLIAIENYITSARESSVVFGIAGIFLNLFTPALDMFAKRHSEVKLTVISGETYELIQGLLESKLDFAVVIKYDYENKKLKHVPICSANKLVCIASPNIVLPDRPIDLGELVNYPLVIGSDNSAATQTIVKKYLEKGLSAPKFTIAVGVPQLLKRCVQNGNGIGFMLMEDVEEEVSHGLLKIIKLKEDISIAAEVIMRSDTIVNPLSTEFIHIIRNAVTETKA